MAGPLIEPALGTIDGVNTLFLSSAMYVPGSVQVWLNGLLKRKDFDDGWTELGSNKILLKEAPEPGDVVQVFYRPL